MSTILYEAGAGTGKTYTITKEIAYSIAAGLPPEALLATTFTRKAAAEMRDRIRQRILNPEKGDPAMDEAKRAHVTAALEAALIGTVHSVGFRLVTRYAFHLGLSPALSPLEENAQERHLQEVLAEMPREPWQELAEVGRRLCQADEQKLALTLLQAKRQNRIGDTEFTRQLTAGIDDYVRVMAPAGASAQAPTWETLYATCQQSLDAINAITDTTDVTAKAVYWLQLVVRRQPRTWDIWGKAAGIAAGKRSGADALLNPLRALARGVMLNEGLHTDLRQYANLLARQTVALEHQYTQYKQAHGVLDFTDQEDLFLKLLEDPDVRADLKGAIQLVVVDEFQDTNPIQLAIFEHLRSIAQRTIWVGDAKQAIYGFRGADDELVEDVLVYADPLVDETMDAVPKTSRRKLDQSWRSRPGLVEAVNRIFEPLMPGASLKPAMRDGKIVREGRAAIHRWLAPSRRNDEFFGALATRLLKLREDGTSFGTCAILTKTHANAKAAAQALQATGIPVVLRTPGLLSTREGVAVQHALRYVADHRDGVAIAHLRHLSETWNCTPTWILDRLRKPDDWATGPSFTALDGIPAQAAGPAAILAEVTQALRISEQAGAWGRPDSRCANLDALVELAWRYEEEKRQEGKAPTLTGLSAWLANLAKEGLDLLPMATGMDAVTISTIHAAKGLEWGTVILVLKSGDRSPDWWNVKVRGGNAAEGKPLEGRTIRLWPYPFGMNEGRPVNDGVGLTAAVLATDIGQDLERRALGERRRLMYVAFTRAKDRLVLFHGAKEPTQLEDLDCNRVLPMIGSVGFEADYSVEDITPADPVPVPLTRTNWFHAVQGPGNAIARYWSPSGTEAAVENITTHSEVLDQATRPSLKVKEWDQLGSAVHAHLAAMPSLRRASDVAKVAHARACLDRWGQAGVVTPEHLVDVGKRFAVWLEAKLAGCSWHPEMNVTGPRTEGGQWAGTTDLAACTATDVWIVDHKSADYREAQWALKAAEHTGQLQVYRGLLPNGASRTFIHLPLGGGIVEVKLP